MLFCFPVSHSAQCLLLQNMQRILWTGFFRICVALLDVDICKELILVAGIEAVVVTGQRPDLYFGVKRRFHMVVTWSKLEGLCEE